MIPTPAIIPKITINIGPIIVYGLPLIQSADAKNEKTKPWASVIVIAIHVQGKLENLRGVFIDAIDSRQIPKNIPKIIGERIVGHRSINP